MSQNSVRDSINRQSAWDRWLSWKVMVPTVGLLLLIATPVTIRFYMLGCIPAIPEPFDVEALAASEIPDEQNAAIEYQQAYKEFALSDPLLVKLENSVEFGFDDDNQDVREFLLSKQATISLWRRGVAKPLCEWVKPRDSVRDSNHLVTIQLRGLTTVTLAESRRLRDEGEVAAAWSQLLHLFRMGQQQGTRSGVDERAHGIFLQARSIDEMLRWAEDLVVDDALLATAQQEFATALIHRPLPSVTHQFEYLKARHSIADPEYRRSITQGFVKPEWTTSLWWLIGEPDMSIRLFRHLYANVLSQCDRPFHLQRLRPSGFPFVTLYEPDTTELDPGGGESRQTPTQKELLSPETLDCFIGRSLYARHALPMFHLFRINLCREQARSLNFELVLALQRYHRRKGTFPSVLTELVNEGLLKQVPIDPFAKPYPQPMLYRLDPDSAWTASVGHEHTCFPGQMMGGTPLSYNQQTYPPGARPIVKRP